MRYPLLSSAQNARESSWKLLEGSGTQQHGVTHGNSAATKPGTARCSIAQAYGWAKEGKASSSCSVWMRIFGLIRISRVCSSLIKVRDW